MFLQKEQRDIIHRDYLEEVNDIIINIVDDNSVCSTLLFDPDFAAMLKARSHGCEPTMDMRLDPCTCNAERTTSLQYQSTFVMPHLSHTGLGPKYQADWMRLILSPSQR